MYILAMDSVNILLIFLLFVVLIVFLFAFQFIGLYVRALTSGARVTMLDLLGMRLRKVNADVIIQSRIRALRAGLQVDQNAMESHVLGWWQVAQRHQRHDRCQQRQYRSAMEGGHGDRPGGS